MNEMKWINPIEHMPLLEYGRRERQEAIYTFWESEKVLLEMKDGGIYVGIFVEETKQSYIDEREDKRLYFVVYDERGDTERGITEVVAWMPLPERCRGYFDERDNDAE